MDAEVAFDFFVTTYGVKYDKENWMDKRVDSGYHYKDGADFKPFTDTSGNIKRGLLDGAGGKLPDGDPPEIIEFKEFREKDFSTFLRA